MPFVLKKSSVYSQISIWVPKRLSPPSERFFSYPQEVDLFHSGSMGIRNPKGRDEIGVNH